jgi:hypothetical protein
MVIKWHHISINRAQDCWMLIDDVINSGVKSGYYYLSLILVILILFSLLADMNGFAIGGSAVEQNG